MYLYSLHRNHIDGLRSAGAYQDSSAKMLRYHQSRARRAVMTRYVLRSAYTVTESAIVGIGCDILRNVLILK